MSASQQFHQMPSGGYLEIWRRFFAVFVDFGLLGPKADNARTDFFLLRPILHFGDQFFGFVESSEAFLPNRPYA